MFNILVADDDKNTRKLIETVLKKENYKVFLANNGCFGKPTNRPYSFRCYDARNGRL